MFQLLFSIYVLWFICFLLGFIWLAGYWFTFVVASEGQYELEVVKTIGYWFTFVVASEGHHMNWRGKRREAIDVWRKRDLVAVGIGGLWWSIVMKGRRKGEGREGERKKGGRMKRIVGANGRWMLMATVVKGRRKGEGKSSVAGWSSWEMDVNDRGEEEGTRAGGIGGLRWSTIIKGRKRGKGRLSTTRGRGRLVLTREEEGTRAGGTGGCQKWWSMMVGIMKGRRRGK
ncbi:hypothetical protein OIU74_024305 [Salix koriyanagi]|uniref:Transmembrane protein n=1 Tax=Salix koriyanagi TaxID=2511006 RepID=A0A9Q0W7W0_9ROSI|nr:hypothetical protein OIU74_024305 [Salix koriyanagi]